MPVERQAYRLAGYQGYAGTCNQIFKKHFAPYRFLGGTKCTHNRLEANAENWEFELLKHKAYRIKGITKGLGYQDGIVDRAGRFSSARPGLVTL
jgi:hypothetical protein